MVVEGVWKGSSMGYEPRASSTLCRDVNWLHGRGWVGHLDGHNLCTLKSINSSNNNNNKEPHRLFRGSIRTAVFEGALTIIAPRNVKSSKPNTAALLGRLAIISL